MALTRVRPTAGKVQGRDIVTAIVGGVNNMDAISIATEQEAATSVAIECYLRDFNPDGSEDTAEDPGRYCDTDTFPSPGKATWAPIELNYVWRPSEDETSPNNKAYATLKRDLEIVITARPDYPKDVAPAVDQFYNAYRVLLGKQWSTRSGDATDANAEWQIKQMAYIQQEPTIHKKFVA